MAAASISVDQDQFCCPVCLDLLKDPVTVPCGHSYCKVCINGFWDQEDQKGVYSCPQCRESFTPRPVLRRNNIIAEMVKKLKKRKRQTTSLCQSTAFKKHKLVEVSKQQQMKICSEHDKLIEIYCRTDQQFICYLCTMDEHKGHDTVAVVAERKEKQTELKEKRRNTQQRLQEKKKELHKVKQAVKTLRRSAQIAVEDSERIFTELICSIEKKRSEVTELIRDQEKIQLSAAEELLEQLEQEISDLKRRNTELEQLSHTEDHIQFLQDLSSQHSPELNRPSFHSEDSTSTTVLQHLSFDGVRKSVSDLKERLEEFCRKEFSKISPHAAGLQKILPSEPKTREDFLQYFCRLTLDPNTVNHLLVLSEENRVVTNSGIFQNYSDHPKRFNWCNQVLSKERVRGRCYWEVEWSGKGRVSLSVSYKEINRKGWGNECWFGYNDQSWSLECSPLSFWHNNIKTKISGPSPSRIGVYVDHSAGTLSFYRVSHTMTLLHTVHTTFTQPLYAGFGAYGIIVFGGGTVRLCDLQ